MTEMISTSPGSSTSVGQVKKYEKGDSAPTLHILARITMVFGVSADELVFEHGSGPAAHKLDAELLKRFAKVAQLPDRERDAVVVTPRLRHRQADPTRGHSGLRIVGIV